MAKTNIALVEWAKSKIGCPYWYGTFGQKATADLLNQKIKQYPSYYTTSRVNRCKGQYGKEVFDCVGLIKGYVWYNESKKKLVYNSSQDLSADTMLSKAKEKGTIKTIPELPGILVHMSGHIGVYIGNGEVIEATVGSSEYVVKKSKLAGRSWTSWLKCPFIEYTTTQTTGFKKGDANLGVFAYKMGLLNLKALGIISVSLNKDSGFGAGTETATKNLQKKLGLSQTGIADEKTIKGIDDLVSKAYKSKISALSSAEKKLSQIKSIL